jgi:hypothetical protein
MTATTTEAPEATTPTTPAPAPSTPAPKTKSAPNPIKSIERMIGKAVKLTSEGSGSDAEKALFTKALRGLEVLVQTIGQTTDPENPPAPDSAWGKTLLLAEGEAKIANLFTPGPRDAF